MKTIAIDIDELRTVAIAVLDEHGVLLQANSGFRRMLPSIGAAGVGKRAARFFIQPAFTALAEAAGAPGSDGYRGLMTIGDIEGKTRTLRGRAWRTAEDLRVMAEYDIDELERLAETMVDLNQELQVVQHDLTHANVALKEREGRIVEQSLTDPLTGLGNRRRLEQALAAELDRSLRNHKPLSVIMADIDHFKRVNDTHGHDAGDKVLACFAGLLKRHSRPSDVVARFGGEEFIVLLPTARLADAMARAEEMRHAIESQTIAPMTSPVTSSFGVAELGAGESAASLLQRVDHALYASKKGGRNCVTSDDQIVAGSTFGRGLKPGQ